jgi:hypothetical protein
MTFSLITVTGTYKKQDGSAASGRVTFQLSSPLIDGSTNEMRRPVPINAILNASGSISASLTATNDPTTVPTGVTYTVVEYITDAPIRTYSVEIAYNAAGATLDLADLVPSTATPTYTYALQSALDAHIATSHAPTGSDYLVGTATAGLSAEIVVGPTPNGELGGTWGAITVDASHGGGTHAAAQAAAEATAAAAAAAHVALPSAHHARDHAINGATHTGTLDDAQIPASIARDSEIITAHSGLSGLTSGDDHTQYQKESEKGVANGYAGLGAGALVPMAQLASGTPDGTKFVRDDGTLQVPNPFAPVTLANGFAGANIGAKIQAADTFLGATPGEIWAYLGGDFGTNVITITDNHQLRLGPGTWTCSISTNGYDTAGGGIQFWGGSHTSMKGVGWATIVVEPTSFLAATPQSSYPAVGVFKGKTVYTTDIEIADLQVLGSSKQRTTAAGATFIFEDNSNCRVRNVYFDHTHAYSVQFGGSSDRARTATITDALNSVPIIVTTNAAHTFLENERVEIVGVGGNTAANGFWIIDKVYSTTKFGLAHSTGNGAYTSGGTAYARSSFNGGWITHCLFEHVMVQNVAVVNAKNVHCDDNIFLKPGGANRHIVSTSGTTVTWIAGDSLASYFASDPVKINGVAYTVTGVPTDTSMTLTTSAGTQTAALAQGHDQSVTCVDFEVNNSTYDLDQNWSITNNLFDYRGTEGTQTASQVVNVTATTPFTWGGPGICAYNTIIAEDIDLGNGTKYMVQAAIQCAGIDIQIVHNVIRGVQVVAISAIGSRHTVAYNQVFDVQGGGSDAIRTKSLTQSYVAHNRAWGTTTSGIIEDVNSGSNEYDDNRVCVSGVWQNFVYSTIQATSKIMSQTKTLTWNPGNILNGGFDSTTVTVTGAAVGDRVGAGFSIAVPAGVLLTAQVTAADTVTAMLLNVSGAAQDLASGTLSVEVRKY